jgi:eukaryotic-like serine/threonine-protein kinase
MAHGDAASKDGTGSEAEVLLPEDVATAPHTTQRRPKQSTGMPDDVDFDIPLALGTRSDLSREPVPGPAPELVPEPAPELVPEPVVEPPPQSAPASDPYLGKIVAERYLVDRLLGVGSMGIVYRCRHTVLDNKLVALKIIRQDLAQDEESVGRFVTEAKAASAIGSSHIVEVQDFGKLPDGATYIVMEYLEGMTLGEAMDREHGLDVGVTVNVGVQIAGALAAAHAVGVVHRDLKPDNVFLLDSPQGYFVKILDFGIAKVMHSGQKLTAVGSVIGTPHYMSPEQATGGRTDARADIYSLGVMMYEMACGKVPFDAENPLAVISMQVTDDPPPLRKRMPEGRSLPPGLESVIMKCLAKEPDERFLTMHDVQAALERIEQGGVPLVAPPASAPGGGASDSMIEELVKDTDFRELRKGERRRRWGTRAAVALGTIAVFGSAAFLLRDRVKKLVTPKPAPPVQAEVRPAPAPVPPAPEPVPAPVASQAPPAVTMNKVTLVTFPLDAHVFEGDTDLGLMPVMFELAPGKWKLVRIQRRGYVTRNVRIDGSAPRVVVGLVSNASAKRKGLSQAEAEAEADRVAATSAGAKAATAAAAKAEKVVADEPAPAPADKDAKPPAVAEKESPPPPDPTPEKAGGKTTLAPNPFQ